MPKTLFRSPPLIEILAEIRWDIGARNVELRPGDALEVRTRAPESESHFFKLAQLLEVEGYVDVYRLNQIATPYRPVLRFKSPEKPTLYQVGPGMFSANSTPPYKSWDDFKPFAERGFECLLKSRHTSENDAPITHVTLRYIDAFRPELLGDRSPSSFMRSVLGFDFRLPKELERRIETPDAIEPNLRFQVRIGSYLVNTLCAIGASGSEQAVIWDTEISSTGDTRPTVEQIMSVLDGAHDIMHKLFVSSTESIHDNMGLER